MIGSAILIPHQRMTDREMDLLYQYYALCSCVTMTHDEKLSPTFLVVIWAIIV